jgi:hypothetical protein
LHSRAPRSVRVSLFYSQKQNQTHANSPHHRMKSRYASWLFVSLRKRKKKDENAKSKSSLEIHPQKPTRDA